MGDGQETRSEEGQGSERKEKEEQLKDEAEEKRIKIRIGFEATTAVFMYI